MSGAWCVVRGTFEQGSTHDALRITHHPLIATMSNPWRRVP
jgi:hypothetical protein